MNKSQGSSKNQLKLSPIPKKVKESTMAKQLNVSGKEAPAQKDNATTANSKSQTSSSAESKTKIQAPKLLGSKQKNLQQAKVKDVSAGGNSPQKNVNQKSKRAASSSSQSDTPSFLRKTNKDKNASNAKKTKVSLMGGFKTSGKSGKGTAVNTSQTNKSGGQENSTNFQTTSIPSNTSASTKIETVQAKPNDSNSITTATKPTGSPKTGILKNIRLPQSTASAKPSSAKAASSSGNENSLVTSQSLLTTGNAETQEDNRNNATSTPQTKPVNHDTLSVATNNDNSTEFKTQVKASEAEGLLDKQASVGTQQTSKHTDKNTSGQPGTSKTQNAKHKNQKDQNNEENESDESSSESPPAVVPKRKPTLLKLAMNYRSQNSQKFQQEHKQYRRYFFDANDNEDPFLTEYYKSQEEEFNKEREDASHAKKERPHIFFEITFNHALNKNEQNQAKEEVVQKQPKHKTGQQKQGQNKTEDKGKLGKASYVKYLKLTYKSLDADGFSIFDNEDASTDKPIDAKDEVRGSKSEMIIRIKKGLYLNNWLEKNGVQDCQLSYIKCYLYDKPGILQKPKKHHSSNCFISKLGKTYWDHAFILRGFTIRELSQLYVVINVKGKYRERYQDAEQDELTPTTPQEFVTQKKEQLVRAIKRRNISLGEFILAGEEAKIVPTAALLYRDPTKEETEPWKEACTKPGISQKRDRRLQPKDEGLLPLTTLENNTTSSKARHRWHSVLSRPRKQSPSSSISS